MHQPTSQQPFVPQAPQQQQPPLGSYNSGSFAPSASSQSAQSPVAQLAQGTLMSPQELQQEIEKMVQQNQLMLQMQMLRKQSVMHTCIGDSRPMSVDIVRRQLEQAMLEKELMAKGARAGDGAEVATIRSKIEQMMREKEALPTDPAVEDHGEIAVLRKQLDRLAQEKELMQKRAREGVDAIELHQQIAALAKQNEQMRHAQGTMKQQQENDICQLQEQLQRLQKENVDLRQQPGEAQASRSNTRRRTSLTKIHQALNAGGTTDEGRQIMDLTAFRARAAEHEDHYHDRSRFQSRRSTMVSEYCTMDLTAAFNDLDDDM